MTLYQRIILLTRYASRWYIIIKFWMWFVFLFSFNSQILKTSNSFHRQFAKQISLAAVTSDLFAVWYPSLCNKCRLIHSSLSDNPADPKKAHIQSKPTAVLRKFNNLNDILFSKKMAINNINEWPIMLNTHENKMWFYQEKLKNHVMVS